MSARGPSDFMATFGQALGILAVGVAIFLVVVLFVAWRVASLFSLRW